MFYLIADIIINTIFGREQYSYQLLYDGFIGIPMPEKTYQALIKFYRCSWKRSRSLSKGKTMNRCDIKFLEAVPVCDDYINEISICVETIDEAIEIFVHDVCKARQICSND